MASHKIPKAKFAILCGSANWGIRFPEDLDDSLVTVVERDVEYSTKWGMSKNWKVLKIDGSKTIDGKDRTVLAVFSHGWPLDAVDHEAHRRVFSVLQEAGVEKVLASSTAGSTNRAVYAREFVIASDVLELTQTQHSLLPNRQQYLCSGKQLICPSCAGIVERAAKRVWPKDARVHGLASGLVAAHAWGPRLTSPSEVTAYRTLGADFLNHSLAPEATLAREIGACFVNCCFVTAGFSNYYDSGVRKGLSIDEVEMLTLKKLLSQISLEAVANFDLDEECGCRDLRTLRPEDYLKAW